MTLLVHVNEASIVPMHSKAQADEIASTFVAVVNATRRRRGDTALVSRGPLDQVELHSNYPLAEWGKRGENRDHWRTIRSLQNRSPGEQTLAREDRESEYRWSNGSVAYALGDAHLTDGLLISFVTPGEWCSSWIGATRSSLVVADEGNEVQIREEEVRVRNVAVQAHVEVHAEWVAQAGINSFESGADLESQCAQMFTCLQFLPSALDQLCSLDARWVAPVAQQLALMNRALVEWSGAAAFPSWYTHVTPDSKSRRESGVLDFTDLDGAVRTFDLHARFTPGAGRVHFRLDAVNRKAVVAHVGPKIQ